MPAHIALPSSVRSRVLLARTATVLVGRPRRWPARETEQIVLGAVRVGQHVFARNVLVNCGNQCVFCGFSPAKFGGKKLLLAGRIKPWQEQHPARAPRSPERSSRPRPAHDVAFDTGMITVNAGCASTSPPPSLTPSGPTRSPGSSTDSHRCARRCCYLLARSLRPISRFLRLASREDLRPLNLNAGARADTHAPIAQE